MTDRPRLALAIPTYQRSGIFAGNLARMIEETRRLGVVIYVSDDSRDAETELALRQFNDIHYRRNIPSLGHDANLVSTLTWPDADYVWLLGDSHWVMAGQLERILVCLEDQDFLMINAHSDDRRMIPSECGERALGLLREMLWHQTLTGATIYHRRVCEWVQRQGAHLIVKPDFPQLSVMLGYASAHEPCVGWFGEPSVGAVKKESYWHRHAIPVFVDHWAALVSAFPAVIPARHRTQVIKSHSARQRLFNTQTLLDLRLAGSFTWTRLLQRRFRDAMHLPLWVLVALLLVPRSMVGLAKRMLIFSQGLRGI